MQLRIKRGKSVRRDNVRLDSTLCPLVTLLTNTLSLAMRVSTIRQRLLVVSRRAIAIDVASN